MLSFFTAFIMLGLVKKQLILASTSKYRKQLLERLQIPFQALAPLVDEESLKNPKLSSCGLAEHLAQAKAQSLLESHPTSIIIGSDQVLDFKGQILGKALAPERAIEHLLMLSGHEHHLITSMAILGGQQSYLHTNITRLKMRKLRLAEVKNYVQCENPIDCAGSYKIEGLGISLFESIETDDFTAIIGLPLMSLCRILRQEGLLPY